jgi:hypothetical protein
VYWLKSSDVCDKRLSQTLPVVLLAAYFVIIGDILYGPYWFIDKKNCQCYICVYSLQILHRWVEGKIINEMRIFKQNRSTPYVSESYYFLLE